uniref:JmjC domain-containing protein n=1 Tax=Panagrolaimus superbus TaxID=310955 RepID=A0A914Z971_9BILA
MEEQQRPNEDDEKKTLEYIGSRGNMKQLSGFVYKEHLNFSAMDNAAKTIPGFPVGWNLHNLPGTLTELLIDTLPIYGVSTSNCYAGELGTWSVAHVENGDLLSANLLLEFSAGKAWTGFNPDEEKKINPFLAKGPRKNCISPLLHVDIMFDNEVYHDKSMEWYYCIQRPGDYVITNPMLPILFPMITVKLQEEEKRANALED